MAETLTSALPMLLTSAAPARSIESYIQYTQSIPMLDADEERELAERLREHNDLEAAQRLILSHLRFVVRVAKGFSGYGLQLADLIQEGNIGLMKAVKRFDPTMGVRLVSFAVHWIKAEMHEFIIKNWRIVKIATTKAQRKLFFNIRNAKKRLGWFSQAEIQGVAEDLGVKPETVELMEMRMNAHDMAFDAPVEADDEAVFSPDQFLAAPDGDPAVLIDSASAQSMQLAQLKEALAELDERSRKIVAARWLAEKKATLHELADELGVSAERIRQLEKMAMDKLRTKITIN